MDIKYTGGRVSHSDDNNRLLIVISGKISKYQVQLLTVWIALWTICGIFVFSQLFQDYTNDLKLALVVYLVFWGYFQYKIGYAFLWRKFGVELISVNETTLSIKQDIKGYGKVYSYQLENISNLDLVEKTDSTFIQTLNNSFWSISEKSITFDYLNKSISFGIQLTNQEAKMLLGKLKAKIRKKA